MRSWASQTQTGIQRRAWNLKLVPSSSAPLQIWVQSWESCKSLVNSHCFTYISPPLQQKLLQTRGCFWRILKSQADLLQAISISIAGAVSLKAMGETQAGIEVESREEHFTLLQLCIFKIPDPREGFIQKKTKPIFCTGGYPGSAPAIPQSREVLVFCPNSWAVGPSPHLWEESRARRNVFSWMAGLRPTDRFSQDITLWLLRSAHKFRTLAQKQVMSIWACESLWSSMNMW